MRVHVGELAKRHEFLRRPVFVIGTGRSGSTLFRALLDGHPELSVWPLEFSYYSAFFDLQRRRRLGERACVNELLESVRDQLDEFRRGSYAGDLGRRIYSFDAVSRETLFSVLEDYQKETLCRKEFLQLLMWAYWRAEGRDADPAQFVIVHNQPATAMIEDFPEARFLALVRDPVATYISTKQYYFKSAELAGVDKSAVYRPYAANSKFPGVIQTAVGPIVFTYDWLARNAGRIQAMRVRLEDLRSDPEKTMREAAAFLGVAYFECLLKATFLGQVHESNLSSGRGSGGVVLPAERAPRPEAELGAYERWWVQNLLQGVAEAAGYSPPGGWEVAPAARPGALEFLRPLKHEFPGRGQEKRRSRSRLAHVARMAFRWASAVVSYLNNRLFFLRASPEWIRRSWPYAP